MRRAGRRALVLGALLAALAFAAAPAAAHADLMSAEPEPNTELDQAPRDLVLDFSEPLEDTYTRVQLVDGNGSDHVQTFSIPGDHRDHLQAQLAALGDGVFTVKWRALSSADGHTTSGSYLLAVNASLTAADVGDAPGGGRGPSAQASQAGADQVEEGGPGEAVMRGLGFLGASLAVGLPLFLLVAHPIEAPEGVRRRWWGLAVSGAGLAALAALGVAGALAARIDLSYTVALGTTPGRNLLLRAGLFAIAGLLLVGGHRWRGREHGIALAATGGLAAVSGLLVTSLGSHAAAEGVGFGLAIAVDWIHQLAVAFWISGVAALALASLSNTPVGVAAELIRRFSPLAVASVVVIVATGVIASTDRLSSPSDLWASLYGFALGAKILLLLPLLALGAYHRYRLLPQLERPGQASLEIGRLRRSAFVELVVMVVVLLAAGAMTTTSPPTPPEERAPHASFDEAARAQAPGPFAPDLERSQLASLAADEAANLTLTLLEPGRVDRLQQGDQTVWLLLSDGRGDDPRPITDADVAIEAWMPEHGHGTSPETDPVHVHEGMYEGATHWLMRGTWNLRFNVTLPEGDVLHYRFPVYVGKQADPLDGREPAHTFSEDGFGVEVFVSPQPVHLGVQNFTVRVTPEDPTFPENADVVVNLDAPSSQGSEGRNLDLDRWREDAWTREDAIFTEEGNWSVLVAFQGKDTYLQSQFPLEVRGR